MWPRGRERTASTLPSQERSSAGAGDVADVPPAPTPHHTTGTLGCPHWGRAGHLLCPGFPQGTWLGCWGRGRLWQDIPQGPDGLVVLGLKSLSSQEGSLPGLSLLQGPEEAPRGSWQSPHPQRPRNPTAAQDKWEPRKPTLSPAPMAGRALQTEAAARES